MTMTPKTYTKLYRKLLKNKWYNAEYDGSTFSYRVVSIGDIEHWTDRIYTVKINIEVKDFKWNERRIWGRDDRNRNRMIRNHFYYHQEKVEVDTMLKIFGLTTQNLKVTTIKIK